LIILAIDRRKNPGQMSVAWGSIIMPFRTLSPQAAVMAAFFLQSFSIGGWYVRVGDVQLALGLTADELGIALMGTAIGALLTFPFGPAAVERFGPKPLLLGAIPLSALGSALAAQTGSAWGLFVALALVGLGHGFATIATNVEADRVELMLGRRIMSTCHGVWSLGFVASTLFGLAARTLAVSPAVHLWLALLITVILALVIVVPMTPAPPRPHKRTAERRPRIAAPTKPILLLILFCQGSNFVEGGAFAWSIIYFRDSFDAPVWLETLALPMFLFATAIGRLMTDRWVEEYGARRVAAFVSAFAAIGLLPVWWAGSLPLALIGFIAIGFGMAPIFPLTISAAARIGDRPASENVASLSVIQRTISLMVPVVIGIVAARWGIAAAFGAMLPWPLLSIALSRYLEPRAK